MITGYRVTISIIVVLEIDLSVGKEIKGQVVLFKMHYYNKEYFMTLPLFPTILFYIPIICIVVSEYVSELFLYLQLFIAQPITN